ncbi:hypothetical protein [Luteimonas sp. SDU101]|uniref:hypothetical protein n=1 Tax=Luteimonas sp. SDU101 TaxID=3422593 RepID=UPI003EC1219C
MSLQALLGELHPDWHAGDTQGGLDPQLCAQARASSLGRRLLLRALPATHMDGLFAPAPGAKASTAILRRWPRSRLQALVRDLGVLAHAPLIRAEVRREPVRWLRRSLGNSYLLALDRSIWDGRVEPGVHARLSSRWEALLADPRFLSDPALLGEVLDRQGRGELLAWAQCRDRPLADWTRLLHAREDAAPAHLPEKALLVVVSHHEGRDGD